MDEYWLFPKDDKIIFFDICKDFELNYPEFHKSKLLVDVDGSLIQPYKYGNLEVVIILERCWWNEIIARANVDLSSFADKWYKEIQ